MKTLFRKLKSSLVIVAVLSLFLSPLVMTGCKAPADRVALNTEKVTITTVNAAMSAWGDWVRGGNGVTQTQIDFVHNTYAKYLASQKLAKDALLAYEKSKDQTQFTAYTAAIASVASNGADVIGFVNTVLNKGK